MRSYRSDRRIDGAGAQRARRARRKRESVGGQEFRSVDELGVAARLLGIAPSKRRSAQLARILPEIWRTCRGRYAAGLAFEDQSALSPAIVPPPPALRQPDDLDGAAAAANADAAENGEQTQAGVSTARPDDSDLAFADLATLRSLLDAGVVSSVELTELALNRLATTGHDLNCVAQLCAETARSAARRMDAELARGECRGPLHGIPWGAKDLFDTADIPTQWGAEPFLGRTPARDAAVVRALEAAGAVLVAKLSLGALAYGDIWYEGRTRSPWNPDTGSSGSSAGSAAATAAGLVPFALGTETMGSIVSPSLVCGTVGLRPTFGRVSRDGCMPLCQSYDKIGPISRTVDDAARVLSAISGFVDSGARLDVDCVDAPFPYTAHRRRDLGGIRVGYSPTWSEGQYITLYNAVTSAGGTLVPVSLPDVSFEAMTIPVWAEAAATFEELTRSRADEMLRWQAVEAWPNTFRAVRFLSSVEYIQAQRLRRRYAGYAEDVLHNVDVVLAPPQAVDWLFLTNGSGHPSLTFRIGFSEEGTPQGATLYGPYWGEQLLIDVAQVLEGLLSVAGIRPDGQ